jgi:hypothetical protein
MKTETQLVCFNHFSRYEREQITARNTLPIDISPLYKPRDGLCCVELETWLYEVVHDTHSKDVWAFTWEVDSNEKPSST